MSVVQCQVINKILQSKDYNIVKTNGLDASYFKHYAAEFNFIDNHYKQFGNIPDLTTFIANFPKFELTEVGETDDYLLDRLWEEHGWDNFVPIMKELDSKLKEDSRTAYNYLISNLPKLKPHTVCRGIDIIANAHERYDNYKNRSNNAEKATIKTGLTELDDIFGGWEFGDELVTIVARTNMGKSWLCLKFLAEAWKQGYRVGLYSGEMNHIKLGYRFDALFGHYSNKCLTYGGYVDGYKEYIDGLKAMPTPFHIIQQKDFGGRPTVQKIRNFVEENNIQILGIDQYSLMEDGRSNFRDPTRLKLAHIAEDLFLLSSEYKIPIIGLCQANRGGVKKDNEQDAPGLEDIKESDDISHNSSKCIGMRQSSFGLVLDIIKNREGKVGDKLLYSWDIDTGHFDYIPSSGDAARTDIREQKTAQSRQVFETPNAFNPF